MMLTASRSIHHCNSYEIDNPHTWTIRVSSLGDHIAHVDLQTSEDEDDS